MDNQIINNELARVWRWDVFPAGDGPVQMSILKAEVGNPSLNLTGRMNGETEVSVSPTPLSVFIGNVTAGHMVMTSDSAFGVFYNSTISSFEASQLQSTIEIPLQQARITGTFQVDNGACQGVCGGSFSGTDPAIMGAVEVSGLMHVGDETNAINQIVSDCACAGIDPKIPFLTYAEETGSLQVMCQYIPGDLTPGNCGSEFAHCQNLGQQCNFAALSANFYDVDTNNNGALDSKTVGGLMGVSGATLTGLFDLIYKNSFE